jgi:hypothetical protein
MNIRTIEHFERYRPMRIRDLQGARLLNPIIKIAVAATIAGAVVFLTTAAPKANAPEDTDALPLASVKGDRLPLVTRGTACSKHGWPNFEHRCQFDFRQPTHETQTVRVIALR